MQGAARDEIVQEMADSAAELLIGLDELNRALVLGPQDCEQLRMQFGQMFLDRVDGACFILRKVFPHMRERIVDDLLKREVIQQAVFELMHELVELRIPVQHNGLLVKQGQHFALHVAVRRAQFIEHIDDLLLQESRGLIVVDDARGLSDALKELRPAALRAFLAVVLEQRADTGPRLVGQDERAQIRAEVLHHLLIPPAAAQPAAERCKEILGLDTRDALLDAVCELFGLPVDILLHDDIAHVMLQPVCELLLRLRLGQPLEQHRHDMPFLQMMENLAPREKLRLDHLHGRMDERIPAPRQDRRMIREAQRLAEQGRHGKPVRDAADERGLRAEEKRIRDEPVGEL